MKELRWIYIISGKGIAEIDDREFEVNPGDFMGFPTPSVAHHLRNPYQEDLIYLMGGENLDVEIADFPHLGKRMIRRQNEAQLYNIADGSGFFEPEEK
ncbi:MAG: cupin domain-containing protein [Prochloraceae cyanobacterium]